MHEEPFIPPGAPAGSSPAMPSGQADPSQASSAPPRDGAGARAMPAPSAGDAAVAMPAGQVPLADGPATAARQTGATTAGSGPAPASSAAPAASGTPAPVTSDRPASVVARFLDEDGEPFDAEEFFNPFSGPPEGADAWLAQVASPVADAWLAARQPSPGGREALAAGFTHSDCMPGARGFAAGGPLDTMEPGPVLAGFAADTTGDGLSGLSDDELIGYLGGARRLASWSASMELAAVSQLAARRAADARAAGDWRQHDHVADEIAVALTLTCRAADKLLDLAVGVTRLPAVTAALAAGRIDLPRAGVYHHELAALADVPAAAIAAVTITDAAALAGRDLPPADVLAADKHIDALARELKKAGTGGTLEQLRARVFIALLTSQPLYTLLPGNGDQDGSPAGPDSPDPGGNHHCPDGPDGTGAGSDRGEPGPVGCQGHDGHGAQDGDSPDTGRPDGADGATNRPGARGEDDDNGRDDDSGHGNGGTRPPRPGPGPSGDQPGLGLPAGLAGSVNLTVPLATWLGLTDHPGEAAGHGPLDAATTRDLATRLAARPGNPWCLTITGQDGRAVAHGCARTTPPVPASPPRSTGPPGQRAGPAPPGTTGPPRSTGPPGGDPRPWLAGLTIHWLETGACGHARQTAAYQPSPALRHLIKTRDRSCAFPGCRRAARRCDDDHTIPTTTAAGPANATWHRFAGGTTPPSKPPAGTSSKPSPAP